MLVSMGIAEFKQAMGCNSIEILVNKNTNKLFAACSNGKNIKVEQAIDVTKPMVVLVEEGELDNACIINKREGAEVKIVL